jgi:NADH-quinone oxidoreductase subunit G
MVNLTIDGIAVTVPEGTTILEAARRAGIPIPTLCYLAHVNEIGACRVCVVEIEGQDQLFASCNNLAEDGMVVHTNSRSVREARRTNVEFILSQHDSQCSSCIRSGNCSLQSLANDLGVLNLPYPKELPVQPWNQRYPLIRDAGKCIKCMRCIQICANVQSIGVWDILGTGFRTTVGVSGNKCIQESDCVLCGQCITHCPTGALHERDDTARAFAALNDPDKITVVQIAPAVRSAWGESLGIERDDATVGRLVAALRRMGFNYIFDTSFAADLTIMEEGHEFLRRLQDGQKHENPMFTSCCPGWGRFQKPFYPDMLEDLSTAKSPQQMFGAVAKTYFAKQANVDPSKIYCVSVMPCLAKKYERSVHELNSAGAGADVDLVLTTREVDRMIRAEHIDAKSLPEEEFDLLLARAAAPA